MAPVEVTFASSVSADSLLSSLSVELRSNVALVVASSPPGDTMALLPTLSAPTRATSPVTMSVVPLTVTGWPLEFRLGTLTGTFAG